MHDCLDLVLDGLAHDGRGVGHLKDPARPGERGLTVFVAGGLPGQTVRCRVKARKARFLEAELVEVLRPAADAVPPLCPHAGAGPGAPGCGGCPLQAMPYASQLEWKTRLARDALARIGGLDADALDAAWETPLPSPSLAGFRNRMTFAFGAGPDGLVLGQRSRGGADVVPTPDCALPPSGGRELLAVAQEAAAQSGLPAWRASERRGSGKTGERGFWRFLALRQGWLPGETEARWWALCLTSPGNRTERAAVRAMGERLLSLGGASRMGGFIHEERGRDDALASGERRILCLDAEGAENPEAALLHLPLAGRSFALDAATFFQVNTGAAELLARTVMGMAPPGGGRGLLDVYCGVGAPGQLLARDYGAVVGMESDRRAVALAARNAADAGLGGCRYLTGDAGALLKRLAAGAPLPGLGKGHTLPTWGTALLDPPRGGLAPAALGALLHLAPEHILYVSCNPATLARDAAKLSTAYTLQRLAAVDLFPHTPHLECCSLWRRR
ncbi:MULTISPECIES: TRAM domain-containing protein [unclassified Desulfovibrio]|uniref:class I SAM-dependent RNA methyltransferase n=1 Tax=unclassified Desulfovibrio TaxID=2593640 RepID=UPI0013EAB5E0|nr:MULTISPECIES: TRAM domain-containing protein [unclassified Desulfovibrio]